MALEDGVGRCRWKTASEDVVGRRRRKMSLEDGVGGCRRRTALEDVIGRCRWKMSSLSGDMLAWLVHSLTVSLSHRWPLLGRQRR
jgi:hypothetical protein